MLKNLIKNPSGEEGLNNWQDVVNGGDGWVVKSDFEHPKYPYPMKFFIASFQQCSKTQVIDLLKAGYTKEVLDAQPNIAVSDWYATRADCESSYELQVQLLSETREVIGEFSIKYKILSKDGANWNQVSHTFKKYGPGVRFVKFTHGGKDSRNWKGSYGIQVSNSSVIIN
ncbi:hypothetical protein GDO81_014005 [Engystomops pustulosus]|uniref:FBA domain-containing protein n=1 Tax=Engystomops pustulosus TaxID=76066 RepID=A0AAV7B7Q3_ENGPU|nr:hypothetical protein GDO81_014005 [Engystomops pustulosus]